MLPSVAAVAPAARQRRLMRRPEMIQSLERVAEEVATPLERRALFLWPSLQMKTEEVVVLPLIAAGNKATSLEERHALFLWL